MYGRPPFILGLLLANVGCGSSAPTVPVSGRVTLDGDPMDNVSVVFQPVSSGGSTDANMGAWDKTNADGKFILRLIDSDKNGAVVGRYKVYLSTAEALDQNEDLGKMSQELIPPSARGGKLSFEVPPGGTTEAIFKLESQHRRR